MTQSRKPHALLLTILLALSTVALSSSTNAEETSARSTGNEELTVSLPTGTKHIERGSSFAVTILATNLAPESEYEVELSLCSVDVTTEWDSVAQAYVPIHTCRDIEHMFSAIDIGSGNSFNTVIETLNDPGYDGTSLYNDTYLILGSLRIQGAPVTSNVTNAFVLGGQAEGWNINGVSNVLIGSSLNLFGEVYFDTTDKYIDTYHVSCSIYAVGSNTPVTTVDGTSTQLGWYNGHNFDITISSPSTAGTHYITCDLIRESNSESMGTWTSENIQVIDEDYTGNEYMEQNGVLSLHFERTDATNTVQFQVSFDIENLYIGTTYSVNASFCSVVVTTEWDSVAQAYVPIHTCRDIPDGFNNEFTIDFTPTTSTESITITVDDPGYDGTSLYNDTYLILGSLRIQGAPVTSNVTNAFVLGGQAEGWNINGVSNVLIGSSLNLFGEVYFDTTDKYIDTYHVSCSIYAVGSNTPVTTVDGTSTQLGWYNGHNFDITISSPSTAGTHYITCDLIRESNSESMGTWTSENIQVIDDTSNQDDASISVSVSTHPSENWGSVVVSAMDTDPGQEYTITWEVVDNAVSPPVVLDDGQNTWVGDNSGTHDEVLRFRALDDTSDACISVTFTVGTEDLQTVTGVCWASQSTSDQDGDGVYDKNDECADTATGVVVGPDGCSDSDGDGFDSQYETDCGSDPNDSSSIPLDTDADDTCDAIDTDDDDDGYLDVDEIAAGTDPLDPFSMPMNALPTCSLYYAIESDGMPTSFTGDAVIPALSGVTAQQGIDSMTPPIVTLGAGSYYIVAHCIDTDGDDITVTVNDVTMGPVAGEVSAGVMIEIGEDVAETMDVTISWTDGTDTLTAVVTLELEGQTTGIIPGFTGLLAISSISCALVFIAFRREDE